MESERCKYATLVARESSRVQSRILISS